MPLKRAWAITIIHKGLNMDKVVIDIGKEFSAGLKFVAHERVHHLSDLMFNPPFAYQRVSSFAKSMWPREYKVEDARLCSHQFPFVNYQHVMHDFTTLPVLQPVHSPSLCLLLHY